ncbi:MAG: sugar phosphate isomerase/epimerase [Deltaproteobacteria bacterium]|nr:sugar phosphate isomerase/epimerase [Deltaproteobacteria bacterium]
MAAKRGVSTCWKSAEAKDGDELISGMARIGLSGLELEYRIRGRMYRQMKGSLTQGHFQVLSIHAPFPLPDDLPRTSASGDLFNMASWDADVRREAVAVTRKTLETANDLEVDRVVLHGGYIEELKDEARAFHEALKREQTLSPAAKEDLERLIERRSEKASEGVDRLLFCLESLLKPAERLGVSICLENRFSPHELPDKDELSRILGAFEGASIGFWLDVGHAAFQERLGLASLEDWLEFVPGPLKGVHVHDCKAWDAHLPPGRGDVDFKRLESAFECAPVLIFEIDGSFPPEAVIEGIEYFENEFPAD